MLRILISLAFLSTVALAEGLYTPALKQYGNTVKVKKSIVVKSGQTFDGRLADGKFTRYIADRSLGDGSQREGQKPIFILEPGARLRNIILDKPSADGVHVHTKSGKTTRIEFIQVRDVGEDAITIKSGTASGKVLITRSSFLKAADKVVQVNAPANVIVENCYGQNFSKFVRTNGSGPNHPYRVSISNSGFRNGDSILKMTNSNARATVSNLKYEKISKPMDLQNGAKADVQRVRRNWEKIEKHRDKIGLFRKILNQAGGED